MTAPSERRGELVAEEVTMAYPVGAVERAMKVQANHRASAQSAAHFQAVAIFGRSPRSIRRLRLRYERYGYNGLLA